MISNRLHRILFYLEQTHQCLYMYCLNSNMLLVLVYINDIVILDLLSF